MNKIRLAKYIADAGVCSRRQASRLIDSHRVLVNGQMANHIDHVDDSDLIEVDNQAIKPQSEKVYFAINKPVGIDCRLLKEDEYSLIHLLPKSVRLYPIGRLDKDSHGLLLLTNDGELCQQLNHPSYKKEKEYRVTTRYPLTDDFCQKMAQGVPLKDVITLPCKVEKIADNQFKIVLTQGLNRQIRKMTKYCGNYVTDLKRIRIANLDLTQLNIQPGEYCEITKSRITQ